MRLVRDNDDPKVRHDLELLARTYGDEEAGAAGAAAEAEGDAAEIAAATDAYAADHDSAGADSAGDDAPGGSDDPVDQLDDPVVRGMVRTSIHVRRFLPYYLGAAVWVLVMLVMSPPSDTPGSGTNGGFAFAGDASSVGSGASVESAFDEEPAPSFADIGATPSSSGFAFGAEPAGDDFAAGDDFDSSSADFDSGSFDDGGFSSGSDFDTPEIDDEPEPLRITKSGYSSSTGGTPLEQEPPEGGLPVTAIAGDVQRRSFIAVSGDESVLKLKPIDDPANAGVESAVVRACTVVLEDWKAERGQSMDDEPLWQEPCVDGKRGADGVFSFDLSKLGKPSDLAGITLTAGTLNAQTFNIVFAPSAVESN